MDILDVLQICIDELDSTTREEFDNKKKRLGIQDKVYNKEEYVDENMEEL
jgi:hypothetical protein